MRRKMLDVIYSHLKVSTDAFTNRTLHVKLAAVTAIKHSNELQSLTEKASEKLIYSVHWHPFEFIWGTMNCR